MQLQIYCYYKWLFPTVPWVCMQRVIVVFSDYTHIFFKNTFKYSHNVVFGVVTWHDIAYSILSHDVASGSDITTSNKIDKTLVVYRLARNVMTSIITLRKRWQKS